MSNIRGEDPEQGQKTTTVSLTPGKVKAGLNGFDEMWMLWAIHDRML